MKEQSEEINQDEVKDQHRDQEWQSFAASWQLQNHESSDGDTETNKPENLLEQVRAKERKDTIELTIDLFIGFALIAFAVFSAIDFFSNVPLIPDEEFINSWKMGVNEMPISAFQVLVFYAINILLSLGLGLLGFYIGYRSFSLRKRIWQRKLNARANPRDWFSAYFDDQIKLCEIGKWTGVGIAGLLWILFILGSIFANKSLSINFADTHRTIAFLGLFVLLPISIYFTAFWREKKWLRDKTVFLQGLQ